MARSLSGIGRARNLSRASRTGSLGGAGRARSLWGSRTFSWPAACSCMASRPFGTEETFLYLLRREMGGDITTSGWAGVPLAASGGAAASLATSGGAAAGPFFLLLRLWVIGGLGLPLTAGGKGGTVSGVELYLGWKFRLPTMVDVANEVPEAKIPLLLHLPQAERLIEADVENLLNIKARQGKFIYIAHFIHSGNSKCFT